ncbi:uncharacterized protein LOC109722311 isoform X1 [Ananas comosus]|uniref:Uncharacterized protein LOC109722311 isoform X1 n=1 Tax=Ananas comosus TaxID=4615 RepID=A0A6P5GDH6_ANACO|nr:uncharacterized protein LOC109722311 isoform X1 [Ananas comosus]
MPIIHGEEGEIGSDAARRGTSDAVFNAFAHAALLKRHEPAEALLASRRAPWLGEALKRDPEKASGRLAIDYSRCSSSYSGIEGSFIMKRAKQHPFFGGFLKKHAMGILCNTMVTSTNMWETCNALSNHNLHQTNLVSVLPSYLGIILY